MKPYVIDSFRFKKSVKESFWKTHPDIEMMKVSHGKARFLDTKEGKNSILIIPDGPNIIEHYFGLVQKMRKTYRVIIVDLFGFGFSIHNGKYDYSFKKTNQFINELLLHLNIKKTSLIFPCANGFYGLAFTHKYPEKVNQLFLLQTPSLGEMHNWSKRIVPSFLKKPYLSQLIMPFVEEKFADKWYDYALPKNVDRTDYKKIALKSLRNGGNYCLCSFHRNFTNIG